MEHGYMRGTLAVLAGCAVIVVGDALLGVQIEIFRGIATFNFLWALDVFLVPFFSGLAVAMIYRERAGKWLAFLPPVIVRCGNVFYLYLTNDQWNENLFFHLHLHYWGLVVILCFQSSYLGGNWIGLMNGSYFRKPPKDENADNAKQQDKNSSNSNSQIGENA